ncbi:MAG TPA: pyridoxamine 5'-phosphate oxidase family protein [Anaerohalosphaeraceae bacterium]|nr:pyridoxamine 5'-phosphate oxidase family protein [Phycisphaerae bacterium]HOK96050.1 pyridoxamine 5'-phosphate oxidase family protein [Anaerohalosphaeraceae bacterium]HOL32020.1 pyridoxamine 5'-phosphate oxidase family protein [Anaerohalosphaeraceae bacterium]HOM76553.1 pyridoxamine 5'-phosphate oxidase family protein [Anaerohalosphaeraceae bacterium]HPC64684.1 pyridoxamine 5'-phosphate oxidase family protein [Anaerohalosphaeraceae bacterium]
MNLNEYFENTDGVGILATADSKGNVDCAIYATPHIIDEETIAFIMRPRLSYNNIRQNPKAVYMFIEKGAGYKGRRLYLEMSHVETNSEKVHLIRRKSHGGGDEADAKLVYFKVMLTRPLVGEQETS